MAQWWPWSWWGREPSAAGGHCWDPQTRHGRAARRRNPYGAQLGCRQCPGTQNLVYFSSAYMLCVTCLHTAAQQAHASASSTMPITGLTGSQTCHSKHRMPAILFVCAYATKRVTGLCLALTTRATQRTARTRRPQLPRSWRSSSAQAGRQWGAARCAAAALHWRL